MGDLGSNTRVQNLVFFFVGELAGNGNCLLLRFHGNLINDYIYDYINFRVVKINKCRNLFERNN